MKRNSLVVGCALALIGLVAGATADSPFALPAVTRPSSTQTYGKEMTATGRVERVRYLGLRRRTCAVEVTTYSWINLSPGFPLAEIPREGNRYTLYAPRDTCLAVEVAAAGANGHILFQAGEGRFNRWVLTARPTPAISCGDRYTL